MAKETRSRQWVTTKQLAEELGCCQRFIRETLKDNLFRSGHHYRNMNPTAWRPTYRWHLKRCSDCLRDADLSAKDPPA